jgi:putative transposase
MAGYLSTIVRSFKAACTQRYQWMDNKKESSLWQRNYFEHVIRGDADLARIRAYIADNPRKWADDRENPNVLVSGRGGG